MKKSLLLTILIIIAVCAVALTGCGGGVPVQKVLSDYAPWITFRNQTEIATYDVVNTVDEVELKGTLTLKVTKYDHKDLTIKDKTIENFVGYYAISSLVMENGDTIDAQMATETTMRVKYVAYSSKIGEDTTSYTADYGKKNLDLVLTVNGEESTDSFKIKDYYGKPFTDNAMVYLVARCLPEGAVTFQMNMANIHTKDMENIVFNRKNEHVDFTLRDKTFKSSLIELAYNRKFPGIGAPIQIVTAEQYICGLDVKDKGAVGATSRAILKITEGNTTYTLKDIKVVENA